LAGDIQGSGTFEGRIDTVEKLPSAAHPAAECRAERFEIRDLVGEKWLLKSKGEVVVVNKSLAKVADKIAETKVANKIVNMTHALNQPKAYDVNGSKMEGSIENLFLGMAVVSHLPWR
jgi:hypothetical protein